jgi:hypothetical protein
MDEDDLHADARRERRAPICVWCGVTALPGPAMGLSAAFGCDNAECAGYGEAVR